jgi:phosphatidylglycerol:prolipoprotein diacylglycerol transferase
MHPVLIEIGSITIRWYGVMIAAACIVGIWVARKEAKRKGFDKNIIQDFSLYAIMGAIIGARFYYVIFGDWSRFLENPLTFFAIWQGGLAIHGGILGGLLVGVFYARKHHISFLKLADTFAPSLILGQAIGRIGCFLNGDAHGYPTSMPWGMVYPPESPAGQMFPGQAIHPTQLYEMILNLIIFSILWKARKKMKVDGHIFLLYVMLYSIIRIFVEHFRADKLTYLSQISAAQSMGILGVILSISFMLYFKSKKTSG